MRRPVFAKQLILRDDFPTRAPVLRSTFLHSPTAVGQPFPWSSATANGQLRANYAFFS